MRAVQKYLFNLDSAPNINVSVLSLQLTFVPGAAILLNGIWQVLELDKLQSFGQFSSSFLYHRCDVEYRLPSDIALRLLELLLKRERV